MHILLTGSSGFTGRAFTQAAQNAGHTVAHLSSNLNEIPSLSAEIAGISPTHVVHLAGISFVGHADPLAFYMVNVLGTMNLLNALAALPVKPQCVLISSSANVYGNCLQSPIQETQPLAPINHYASSKMAMEHMAKTQSQQLPLVFTRPFNYTGAGQTTDFLVPKLVDHFLRKADHIALGNLNVEREFNDVRMVCEAYLKLLTVGEPGQTYNICTGTTYTLRQLIESLERLTGHTMTVETRADLVRSNEVHRLCGNPEKLLAAIGKPSDFALLDTLKWMLNVDPS